MSSELKRIIEQISRDRGFDKELLIEAIEEAVQSAARKKLGSRIDIEAYYDEGLGLVEIIQFFTVVEEVTDEQTEISLEDALRLEHDDSDTSDVQLGAVIGVPMEDVRSTDLGRIAAQSARQVIINKMRDAERGVIFDMFKDRKGEVVSGIVQRFDRGNMVVNLGRTDALLPRDQQIPKRSFKQGDRIKAYLLDVREGSRDYQLLLSRTCDDFLAKLFEMEVPEIKEGIVNVIAVSREPGFRAKIAVSSSEGDVDPVGACVGMKGSRVQNVVQELQGERIDIVTWSPDPAKYVYNALAPAHVNMVRVDEDTKTLLVVVPNDQLSLAIGRQGQNVRLASRLMGWRIDVKSEQRYANLQDAGYQSLLAVEGIEEALADQLFAKGIVSAAALADKTVEELAVLRAVNEEFAEQLIASAREIKADYPDLAGECEQSKAEIADNDSASEGEKVKETEPPGEAAAETAKEPLPEIGGAEISGAEEPASGEEGK
ncbi:MAG: transcription termination/antitermination protein NusA [Deltaproteobacteria bacterium]|nr:MAG: transcription termination/antitermination protein NusA [Deltaproteobacteria bacterium]